MVDLVRRLIMAGNADEVARSDLDCAERFYRRHMGRVTAFVMTPHRNAHLGKGEPVPGQRMPIVFVPVRGGIPPSFFPNAVPLGILE